MSAQHLLAALSGASVQDLTIYTSMLLIGITWWPSHRYFKWVRTKRQGTQLLLLSICGCCVLSSLLIFIGWLIGTHASPAVRTLGEQGTGAIVNYNLLWFPFAVCSLGLWAGLLSGYFKMKISK